MRASCATNPYDFIIIIQHILCGLVVVVVGGVGSGVLCECSNRPRRSLIFNTNVSGSQAARGQKCAANSLRLRIEGARSIELYNKQKQCVCIFFLNSFHHTNMCINCNQN